MVLRPLWMAGGLVSVGLAWMGIFLPILPTVPFLLLALFCFARGNPAWERRLLDHPRYGAPLRDWRERPAISRRSKIAAVLAMAWAGVLTWLLIGFPAAWISMALLAIVAACIWTRPE